MARKKRRDVVEDYTHYRQLDLPALVGLIRSFGGPRWRAPAMCYAIEQLLARSEVELVTGADVAATLGEPDEKSSARRDELWTYLWLGKAGPAAYLSATTFVLRGGRVIGAHSIRRRALLDTDNADARQQRCRYRAMA